MQSVSSVLYNLAEAQSQEGLSNTKRRCFIWIWQWLLMHQPYESLQKELTSLENTDKFSGLKPTFIQELSWKAEALESLLATAS